MHRIRFSQRSFLCVAAVVVAGLAVSASFSAMLAAQAPPADQNEALVRRYIEEVWNQQRVDIIDEIVAPDFYHRQAGIRGRDGHRQWCAGVQSLWPNLEIQVVEMVATGDRVIYTWRADPATEAMLFGLPPADEPVQPATVLVVRIADKMIAEMWEARIPFDVYAQAGGVSAQGTE